MVLRWRLPDAQGLSQVLQHVCHMSAGWFQQWLLLLTQVAHAQKHITVTVFGTAGPGDPQGSQRLLETRGSWGDIS